MPIETIKCQECGSAEVTEFKSGSYVCGHCETTFKHVNPAAASGGAAGCEIDACGVAAIGRCSTCGRAFCGTHQAHAKDAFGTTPYIGWCTSCQGQRLARDRDAKAAEPQRIAESHAVLTSSSDLKEISRAVQHSAGDPAILRAAWTRLTKTGTIASTEELLTIERRKERFNTFGSCREISRRPLWRQGTGMGWFDGTSPGHWEALGEHPHWPREDVADHPVLRLGEISRKARKAWQISVLVPSGSRLALNGRQIEIPGGIFVRYNQHGDDWLTSEVFRFFLYGPWFLKGDQLRHRTPGWDSRHNG